MSQLLSGVKVIDLTRVLAGPYCTMMLGDLGADVIKIEAPELGDDTRHWGPPFAGGESAYFLSVNRNKRSLTLNLKSPQGMNVLKNLIKTADILIENFNVGTLKKWGLTAKILEELCPGLIYCTITGFGYTGPLRNHPGYDFIIQAMGGIMSITGPEDGDPYKVGVAITDITAGQNAAIAILAALYAREKTKQGQRIDISLLDSQVAWLANVASNFLISGKKPKRYGNAHPNIVPYQVFMAKDRSFALAIGNDHQWQKFCDQFDHKDWGQDKRFMTNKARVENRKILIPLMESLFSSRELDEWLRRFEESGIPVAPINTIDRTFGNAQVIARNLVEEINHPSAGAISIVASPLTIPNAPTKTRYPPPLLGQHSKEILMEYGYDSTQIELLQENKII